MNRFLQNFLRDAPGKLSEARRELQILREQYPSDEAQTRQRLRRIFQQAHTLKGSAAAFGIEVIRNLAHELEDLLDGLCFGKTVCDQAALTALEAGIEKIEIALTASSEEKDRLAVPQDLQILIRDLKVNENQTEVELDESHLPAEFLEKLNEFEKRHLQQFIVGGASVYVLAVKFSLDKFQEKLQSLRTELSREGEIVAVLPGTLTSPTEIALQIVFAANAAPPNFLATLKSFNGEILFADQTATIIADAAATAFLAGHRAAIEVGKEIEFDILGGELKITREQANVLTTALLHLVTNAVMHGIESPAERLLKKKPERGTIRVTAEQTPVSICISVVDDGGGIDFEKIAQKAEKKFAVKSGSAKSRLAQARELIFMPGFSTTESLTQFAGRGVGLDAAKSVVESVGGTIQVSSKIGAGTTFEMVLPLT